MMSLESIKSVFSKVNDIKDMACEAVENAVDQAFEKTLGKVIEKHGEKMAYGCIGGMIGNTVATPAVSALLQYGAIPEQGLARTFAIAGTHLIGAVIGAVATNIAAQRINNSMMQVSEVPVDQPPSFKNQ